MFGWGRKRAHAVTVTPAEAEAYQSGQRAGASFATDLEAIFEGRFRPLFNGYLAILRDRIRRRLQ